MRVYHRDGTVLAVHADASPGGYQDAKETWLPDGFGVRVGGPMPATEALAAWPVEDMRVTVAAFIDAEAERRRNEVLTPGSGQVAAYQRKEAEARAFLADPAPDIAAYPYVAAEVGVTAETATDVAQVIVAMASAWWAYGAALERVRLTAKRDIGAAGSPEDVAAILAGVEWPEVGA